MKPSPAQSNVPVDSIVELTGASFTAPAWDGVSELIAEYPVTDTIGSFVLTFQPLPAADYIIAIRGVVSEGVVTRYKLYSTGTEVLDWPVYAGQFIPAPATIEIWTHEQTPEGEVVVPTTTMRVGYLNFNQNNIPTQQTFALTGSAV